MKYIGPDNKSYNINFNQYAQNSRNDNKSQYHLYARELIAEIFVNNPVYEEVLLPGCESLLYADFFIPTQNKVIEVHGEQHYTDNSFFYRSYADFLKAKKRDRTKQEWCRINRIDYIELSYKESVDEWRAKLCG